MGNSAVRFLAGAEPGTRVVVRTRIEGGFTDAVGYLRSFDEAQCVVETKRGPVALATADIVLAKEVPPPPAPRAARRAAP